MIKCILKPMVIIILLIIVSAIANAQTQIIVNEFSQGDAADHDWIELVVTEDGADIRGVYFTTTTTPNASDYSTKSVQLSTTLGAFSNVSKGSIIVIYKSADSTSDFSQDPLLVTDTDFADGKIVIPHDNTTFLEVVAVWPSFKNSGGDNIGLLTDGGVGIHAVSYSTAAVTSSLFGPGTWGQIIIPIGVSTGTSAYYTQQSSGQAGNSANWAKRTAGSASPGVIDGTNDSGTPSVNLIINEFSQGDAADHDWIELVVTEDGADIRGVYFTTTTTPNASDYSTKSVQLSTTLGAFSNVSKGSIIVIYKSADSTSDFSQDPLLVTDTDFADGKIVIPHDNTTFLEVVAVWPSFKNSAGDNIGLLTDGGVGIHAVSYGTAAVASSVFGPGTWGQIIIPTDVSNVTSAHYVEGTDDQAGNSANWAVVSAGSATPGDLNGGNNNALPVELVLFSAVMKANEVILHWKTETEVNNYGFNVERKRDDENWNTLGFVEGHGNSNSPKEYSFLDSDMAAAGKYFYRLKQIDNDGSYEYSQIIQVDFDSPVSFELKQNYPNPFNPSTTITFTLPANEIVSLSVYNILGEEIQILQNGFLEAGMYSYNFNAEGLPSGFYIYKLSVNNFYQTKKMLLLK